MTPHPTNQIPCAALLPAVAAGGGFHLFSRERVAAGQDYEVRYEAKKTGKSKGEVKRAIKRAGPSRRNERW